MSGSRNRTVFGKVMSDPVPLPQEGIDAALAVMRTNRPFRYGEDTAGEGPASRFEAAFARTVGRRYAAAASSCGASLFLALRALGVGPGDPVLCNAFTLAPVPGAVAHANARPVLVDITDRLTIDLADLERKIGESGSKVLLHSQMRGHMGNMEALMALCDAAGVVVIEDCAHTLGARWNGRLAGTFGAIGCYSTQTFKHLNAGEGGVLATDDDDIAARAIIMSGSYMMYAQAGARPPLEAFEPWRDTEPNFSMRMTDIAGALLLPQLDLLPQWIDAYNARYRRLEAGLSAVPGIRTIARDPREEYVGSSIQFFVERDAAGIAAFAEDAAAHGVFLKWFGAPRTKGFTSRFDQWAYADPHAVLPGAADALSRLVDMRVALSLSLEDCDVIVTTIGEALQATGHQATEFHERRGC